jgi:DNA repair protein RadC
MSEKPEHISIKNWAEDDQPREKLLSSGKKSLSDAELMAILLRSGSKGESALSLSKRILNNYQNDLYKLGKASLSELMQYKGIGEAKAISIVAALELGRRRQHVPETKIKTIASSKDAFSFIAAKLQDLLIEEFWVILLSQSSKPIKTIRISTGGVSSVVVDTRIVLRQAISYLASGLILIHNHPSGQLKPSKQDINLTNKLKEGASLFDIKLLDHLIVTDNNYYSFADEGII